MKVSELIEHLKDYPNQDAEVLVIESENWQYDAMSKGYALKTESIWNDNGDMNMLITE